MLCYVSFYRIFLLLSIFHHNSDCNRYVSMCICIFIFPLLKRYNGKNSWNSNEFHLKAFDLKVNCFVQIENFSHSLHFAFWYNNIKIIKATNQTKPSPTIPEPCVCLYIKHQFNKKSKPENFMLFLRHSLSETKYMIIKTIRNNTVERLY